MPAPDTVLIARARRAARNAAIAAALIAALGLLGWLASVTVLVELVPGRPRITPNTSIGLLLVAAGALLLAPAEVSPRRRALGRACALVVLALALASLGFAVSGAGEPIVGALPRLLAALGAPLEQIRVSSAAPTALCLVLLSTALALGSARAELWRRAAQVPALAAAVVVHAVLTGHAYSADLLFRSSPEPMTGTSLPAALALGLLAGALLFARPERGVAATITSPRLGGAMARKLLLPALAGPSALGLVMLVGIDPGSESLSLSHALLASASATISVGLTLLTAASLNRTDAARARAAEELQLWRDVADSAEEAIIVETVDEVVIGWNPAAERLLGWRREEMLGRPAVAVVPADRRAERARASAQLVRGERVAAMETVRVSKSGERIDVAVSLTHLKDRAGRPVAMVAILSDLRERKAARAALERLYREEALAKAWLQGVLDGMPEAVLLVDAEGRVSHNRAAKALMTGGEGAPAFDLRRPDGARLAADEVPLMRALQAGEVVHGLELVAAREGEAGVPVLVSASPLPDAAGRRVGAVSVLRDISRLKEMERLREEWTAIVAHDLRQPLGVIALASQMLARTLPPDAATSRALARIDGATGRLRRMIRDLLDAARLDAHQLTLDRAPVDLGELLGEVVARTSAGLSGRSGSRCRQGCRRCWPTPAASTRCSRTCCRTRASTAGAAARSW